MLAKYLLAKSKWARLRTSAITSYLWRAATCQVKELCLFRRRKASGAIVFLSGKRRRLERETGFEPATPAMARQCSTTELFPRLI